MLDYHKNLLDEARTLYPGTGSGAEALMLYADNVKKEIAEMREIIKGKERLVVEIGKLRDKIIIESVKLNEVK